MNLHVKSADLISFTYEESQKCFYFSKGMIGNHKPDTIGSRSPQEIFRDDLRGKLAEIAVLKYIKKHMPNARIDRDLDFRIYPRGIWDVSDLIVNGKNLSIKSVKRNSSFLMIETERFKSNGNCSYQNNDGSDILIDDYILVRVFIDWPDGWPAKYDGININEDLDQLIQEESKRKPESLQAEILGGIEADKFWDQKHLGMKNAPCDLKSLQAICKGEYIPPVDDPENYSRTAILQNSNYIIAPDKLVTIETLIND